MHIEFAIFATIGFLCSPAGSQPAALTWIARALIVAGIAKLTAVATARYSNMFFIVLDLSSNLLYYATLDAVAAFLVIDTILSHINTSNHVLKAGVAATTIALYQLAELITSVHNAMWK